MFRSLGKMFGLLEAMAKRAQSLFRCDDNKSQLTVDSALVALRHLLIVLLEAQEAIITGDGCLLELSRAIASRGGCAGLFRCDASQITVIALISGGN